VQQTDAPLSGVERRVENCVRLGRAAGFGRGEQRHCVPTNARQRA